MDIDVLHPEFGATIEGVDLSISVNNEMVTRISSLIDKYSFLCFPNQRLSDKEQLELTQKFGDPEPNHVKLGQDGVVDYFGTIGNVLDNGAVLTNSDKRTIFQTGNNMWHTDSSFQKVPTYVSIMYVYEVPEEGGQTEFASCRSAFDRLSNDMKNSIDNLIGIHSYKFSRSKIGADAVTPSHAASLPPVKQKLVRKNYKVNRKNYFIGSHVETIDGWELDESRELLDYLLNLATQKKHVYSHDWRPGELVIWDNRCLIHRGVGYNASKYRRRMRQTRVCGQCSTIEEKS